MKKVNLLTAAVTAALLSTSALAVDFNGYMRAGTGLSGNSGDDVSYNKNGIGRLGNENDNYYEFGFAEDLQTGEVNWRLESMIASGTEGANGWEDSDFNVAQFAVKAKGIIASDKDATLWAGKTYYQRKDIHITDFYYLNTSGTGGGIENLSVGNQKLSLALIQDGETDDSAGFIFDARLANIGLWSDANLEIALAYNFANEKDGGSQEADDGLLATFILQQGLSNGFNQTVFQYGTNGYGVQAANFWGSGAYYARGTNNYNDSAGYRLLNWGVISMGDSWEMGHQLAFMAGQDIGDDTGATNDTNQYSVVVRPMYKWNDTMRTVFEAGYNAGEQLDNLGGTEDFGNGKVTVAQAWAMGSSFWARPEIRVYGSYIVDTEDDNAFGQGNDTEYVVGIQAEAWW
ncbi:maltoporin [Vibrio breoganii]|uniref:Maltoporin n=1 Tax=Vibrio breoganii TaxID=553239 RepID=A0AAN0XX95_9VIBR|nr:maltoporin LamB [Vibrio breoganii]ANO34172.1 maltoporin [Vibrio breoganii]PMK28476.1 maltoporin [Vibrio breoganii]PMK41392.1 maltoporin [Vibrio breoganii]PML06581.1 maltoporin [Vibrio breoganii]PML11171.1 maltoporin [Vibrio breoganii]